ncbi:MAG: PepSY domain-containing protein [Candidatus Competibacteraceae bacterium]|nr:MAG: PepSY domain-containing protein [Candidatus Competibacteraceae bacterium]
MNRKIYLVVIAALSTAAVGSAYAAESAGNDALAIADAKISLTQAVAAAEQHVGGKASRAEYEHEKGQSVFEVEVVKGQSVMDVKVDPTSGQVIASAGDKADHNEDKADHNEDDETDD